MAHTVAVGEFEGPLGILLDLVERKKLEVTAISVAEITAEYLARVRRLESNSPEELSDFVQLGARLLYIKSFALLPVATASSDQDEELRQLNLELTEYRRLQSAARLLSRQQAAPTWERQATERLSPGDLPLPNITLAQLNRALTEALRRVLPAPKKVLPRKRISFQIVSLKLQARLTDGFELQNILDECEDHLEIIITFLALLELVRENLAQVEQPNPFGAIRVEAHRG
ncbi:MAG: chromosome segregation and condensation protein ScpA [Patescibacteria group bacterium]|nr:chromosome segregation and condensation protein ScpA [Patescibacteria group bacterium]